MQLVQPRAGCTDWFVQVVPAAGRVVLCLCVAVCMCVCESIACCVAVVCSYINFQTTRRYRVSHGSDCTAAGLNYTHSRMRQPPWAPDTSLPFHHTIFEPALTCL
uniref:Uncharacterized protein n=1 Tax=Anopheles quadriannulatus TaxID=34691 RepID=A0A182XD21_ANOQN